VKASLVFEFGLLSELEFEFLVSGRPLVVLFEYGLVFSLLLLLPLLSDGVVSRLFGTLCFVAFCLLGVLVLEVPDLVDFVELKGFLKPLEV